MRRGGIIYLAGWLRHATSVLCIALKHGGRESIEIEELGQHYADSRGGGRGRACEGGGGWEEAGKRDYFPLKLYVRTLDTALNRAEDMAEVNW
jgi:hypothetical protein